MQESVPGFLWREESDGDERRDWYRDGGCPASFPPGRGGDPDLQPLRVAGTAAGGVVVVYRPRRRYGGGRRRRRIHG